MNVSRWAAVIITSLLFGCSATYEVVEPSSRNPFNKKQFVDQVAGRSVTVELADGTHFDAMLLQVGPDSCIWMDRITGHSRSIRTKDIKTVVERKHFLGALEGIGLGTLSGASIGTFIFWASGPSSGDVPIGGGIAIMLGGVAGGLIGAVYGAASGHLDEYEFVWFSKIPFPETRRDVKPQSESEEERN